jgi:hypothetical protein
VVKEETFEEMVDEAYRDPTLSDVDCDWDSVKYGALAMARKAAEIARTDTCKGTCLHSECRRSKLIARAILDFAGIKA